MPGHDDYERRFRQPIEEGLRDGMHHEPEHASSESFVDQIDAVLSAYEHGEPLPELPEDVRRERDLEATFFDRWAEVDDGEREIFRPRWDDEHYITLSFAIAPPSREEAEEIAREWNASMNRAQILSSPPTIELNRDWFASLDSFFSLQGRPEIQGHRIDYETVDDGLYPRQRGILETALNTSRAGTLTFDDIRAQVEELMRHERVGYVHPDATDYFRDLGGIVVRANPIVPPGCVYVTDESVLRPGIININMD